MIYVFVNNLLISIIPIILVLAIGTALAFYKVSGWWPLVSAAEAAFKFYTGGKLYIWKKEDHPPAATTAATVKEAKSYASVMVPKISDSKLKDLSWSLDIKESIYSNKNQR